jgi:hypothetical protein
MNEISLIRRARSRRWWGRGSDRGRGFFDGCMCNSCRGYDDDRYYQ